jgi:hypothetical protein
VGFSEWARGGGRQRQGERGGAAGVQIRREKGKKGEVDEEKKNKGRKKKREGKRGLWTFHPFYLPLAKILIYSLIVLSTLHTTICWWSRRQVTTLLKHLKTRYRLAPSSTPYGRHKHIAPSSNLSRCPSLSI